MLFLVEAMTRASPSCDTFAYLEYESEGLIICGLLSGGGGRQSAAAHAAARPEAAFEPAGFKTINRRLPSFSFRACYQGM